MARNLHKLEDEKTTVFVNTADYPPRSFVINTNGKVNLGVRFRNVGIREQHLIAHAHGLVVEDRNNIVVNITGDAFLYRCSDQLNASAMTGVRHLTIAVEGGLSGSQNGPTHQSIAQPVSLAKIPGIQYFDVASFAEFKMALNFFFNNSKPTIIRIVKSPAKYPETCREIDNSIRLLNGPKLRNRVMLLTSGLITIELEKYLAEHNPQIDFLVASVFDLTNPTNSLLSIIHNYNIGAIVTAFNGEKSTILSNSFEDILMNSSVSIVKQLGFSKGNHGSIHELLDQNELNPEAILRICKEI